ncbi:MAG: hypothetical protein DRI52_07955 [Chloroflexi bacterium]|nr:MAG: hypothetical protein DRI52_07955 [Chloroflexota bacterium]
MRGSKISALIDTDIAIDYLRGREEVKEMVEELWDEGKAYLSAISVYELSCGMREGEKEMTEAFIEGCEVVEVDRPIAQEAGRLYREYRRIKSLSVLDGTLVILDPPLQHVDLGDHLLKLTFPYPLELPAGEAGTQKFV